jgi:hypothetical protein
MPGSYAYNGTCIYFSTTNQKLSWIQAERFCKSLPLNTSFLIIQNDHQYEFIRRKLIKLKEKENPIDNLMFYIGFKKEKSLKIFYFYKLFIIKMIFLEKLGNGRIIKVLMMKKYLMPVLVNVAVWF